MSIFHCYGSFLSHDLSCSCFPAFHWLRLVQLRSRRAHKFGHLKPICIDKYIYIVYIETIRNPYIYIYVYI